MLEVGGWLAFLALLAGGGVALLLGARKFGVLGPVAVGIGARLACTFIAHFISVANGDDGFLYLDDRGYESFGKQIAAGWENGNPEPLLEPLGQLIHGGPLFYDLVGGVFFLTGDSVVAMKLVNVLLASTMILSAAVIAREFLPAKGVRLVAWLVALTPTLVWWTAPMMKEPLAGALVMGTLAAATALPRARGAALTALLLAALALARTTLALAVSTAIAAWLTVRLIREWRKGRAAWPVGATALGSYAAIGLITVLVVGGGNTESVTQRAKQTVERGRQEAKVPSTKDGGSRKDGEPPEPEPAPAPSGLEDDSFDSAIGSELAKTPVTEAAAAGIRFIISPRAWAFTTQRFDWYQPVYQMMWFWYALIPLAVVGAWLLRRRPEVLLLLVPVTGALAIYAATLASGVRQRSAIEPLVLILVVAGAGTWRRSGALAAGGLAAAAVFAAADLANPLVAIPILLAAAGMWAWSRRPEADQPVVDLGSRG